MRLLIAGWHGQVARALIEAAPGNSHVKALAAGRPALDVRDPRSIERAFGDISPDVVINSAAYTAVDKAESDQDTVFALNRDGAHLLASAAARRNIPVIHLSTHYVFDGTKPLPYDEQDAPCPTTVYGRSKYEGEQATIAANPHHVIVRTGWVFSSAKAAFAARMLDQAKRGERVRVVADQHGNPTYAPHLASALLELARQISVTPSEQTAWGIYHAAGAGAATWHGLASEIVARGLNGGAPAVEAIQSSEYPSIAPRPRNSELDSAKFARTFGLRLPPWQEGVAACVLQLSGA